MKSIKELREQYQVITEKEDKEQRKLTALVRAGLFDAKKLPMLKRALEKGVDKMTPAEKKILIDLLDSLMNQVVSNEPVYMKVKRNVQSMDEEIIAEAVKTPVTISDVPSIVVLKRKAVRVYPGGQQVGLYYSQQLDKYVTIPFGEAGISEEVDLEEQRRPGRVRKPRYKRPYQYDDDDDDDVEGRRAENKPYEKLSASERKLVTPGKVAAREFMSGGDLKTIATKAFVAAMLRRGQRKKDVETKIKKSDAFAAKRKLQNQDAKKLKGRKLQAITTSRAKLKAAKAATKTVSPAIAGTMQSRIRQVAQKKTITESNKLRLVRKQQIDEALPLVPLVAAAGRAALPYIARGASAAGPALGRLAGQALSKGKSIGKRVLDKFKGKRGGSTGRSRGRNRGRGRRPDIDFNAGNNAAGSQSNQPSYKTPVTHSHTSQLKTNIVAPERSSSRSSIQARDEILQRQANRAMLQREFVEVNLDGNLVEINSSIAEKLVKVYESLNDYNKQKMVDMLINEETQNKIVEFVRRY